MSDVNSIREVSQSITYNLQTSMRNLYNNTVLDVGMILSVILSVRYRNHFPVVQFQNQAYTWNPHGTGQVFKTIWGTAGAP